MRKLITCLIITFLSFGLVVNEASAKRFGGGRSFGAYRSANSFSSPIKKNVSNNQTSKNRWGGVLGGLLVGGLLASLFMGHGLASGILSWLMIAALVLIGINLYRRRMQPNFQSASNHAMYNQQTPMDFKAFTNLSGVKQSADFDEVNFLRAAKVMFIRLQEAYDKKNLADISEFTSPEVFAEIKIQFDERGEANNHTDVVKLEAKILEWPSNENNQNASVLFWGVIKEEENTAESFEEIWHFQLSEQNDWVVSGVQQKRPL